MNIPKFRRWLESRIAEIRALHEPSESDLLDFQSYRHEAYEHAVELGIVGAVKVLRKKQPPLDALLEALGAIAPKSEKSTLTPPEVAERLGVCSDTVRAWCESKKLKASNVGNKNRDRWLVKVEDLETFLEQQQPRKQQKPTRVKTKSKRY